MSWIAVGTAVVGGAKAASGLLGASNKSKGMRDRARDTLLTARSNINNRKIEARQTQFAVLESGQQQASQVQRAADQAVGKAKATAGGSGAVVDGGTPSAVLSNIAQEGLHAQMEAIVNTKNHIKAIKRDTENMNKSEWNQAQADSSSMKKAAKDTLNAGRLKFVTDLIETGIDTYTAGASKWGKGGETKQLGKQIGTGDMHGRDAIKPKQIGTGDQHGRMKILSSSGRNVYDNPINKSNYKSNFNWRSNPWNKRVSGSAWARMNYKNR